MLIFYDFECFKHDWLVVFIRPSVGEETVIVNDPKKLAEFYEQNKNRIFVGFNSRNYDQYILQSILCGFNPKEVNDWIIVKNRKGWEFSDLLRAYPIINYDTMTGFHGLKTLEAFMGNDIKETSVPFDIDRKLTQSEIDETVRYCRHDVEQTIEVFIERKNVFDSQLALIKTFELPISYIGKTQAQLSAIILGASRRTYNDDWQIRLPDTLNLTKYAYVGQWFLDPTNHDEESKLTIDIAGVPHVFAWGGVHGAIEQYQHTCNDNEVMYMIDVDQLYPSLMIRYDLLSRGVKDPKKFETILATSLRLKAEKKKKEREPYKLICNITYGAEGDSYNAMYDPLHRKLVCVYGQVLILDLIERIEPFVRLIQSNTDGILVLLKKNDIDRLKETVHDWEIRTGLHMSFDAFRTIIQKDVNNYIAIDYDGHSKSKGAYVKSLSRLDNDLPIVNRAVLDYIIDGVPVEQTINGCHDYIQFQKIVKVSSKYKCGVWNGERLNDKTYRVFASKDPNDGFIGKSKDGFKVEKFANTPMNCYVDNSYILDKTVPDKLDRDYYIQLARKRLNDYGVE